MNVKARYMAPNIKVAVAHFESFKLNVKKRNLDIRRFVCPVLLPFILKFARKFRIQLGSTLFSRIDLNLLFMYSILQWNQIYSKRLHLKDFT